MRLVWVNRFFLGKVNGKQIEVIYLLIVRTMMEMLCIGPSKLM